MENNMVDAVGNDNPTDSNTNESSAEGEAPQQKESHGSGPSGHIPDGGASSDKKQPKENTGNDSNMGGAGGGTAGMGKSKEKSPMDKDED